MCNRPHRPRDPILRDYLAAIGVTWPETAKPSGESEDESESTSEDVEEESESEDGEDDECEEVGEEGTWGSIEIFLEFNTSGACMDRWICLTSAWFMFGSYMSPSGRAVEAAPEAHVETPSPPVPSAPDTPLIATPPPKYPVVPLVSPSPVSAPVSWL